MISMENIIKNFGHVQALRGANFYAHKGKVTALVGDNGSGKSTLIKILCGILYPDKGTININNKSFKYLTPKKAIQNGISSVYQDLALDNEKDCSGNIFLGREKTKFGFWLDKKSMEKETESLLNNLNINIQDITLPVGYLSGGQRQALAIARAIHQNTDIIVLDEPTSAMGLKETNAVMDIIHSLKDMDKTIIIISHNLFQVFDIADYVCVMKSGRCGNPILTKESTPEHINRLIVGGYDE